MSGAPFLREGGFSHLVLFHRCLGSNDEAADIPERAERILYFLPHDTPTRDQLAQIGLFEGLIDFSTTFSGEQKWMCIDMNKRRYAFLEVEPSVWMVLAVVKPTLGDVPSDAYPRSTGSAGAGRAAHKEAGGHTHTHAHAHAHGHAAHGHAHVETLAEDTVVVTDAALVGMLQRLYFNYVLFYGSISRVIDHPNCQALLQRIAHLCESVRVHTDALARLRENIRHLKGGDGDTGAKSAEADSAAEQVARMEASAARATMQLRDAEAQLVALRRFSPAAAVRYTLRSVFDFHAHYMDWTRILPYDAFDGMRYHRPANEVWRLVDALSGTLKSKGVGIDYVAFVYDGIVVYGRHLPGLHAIMHYLRSHCFHVVRGSYMPDRRPLDFAASVLPGDRATYSSRHDSSYSSRSGSSIIRMPSELFALKSQPDTQSKATPFAARRRTLEESLLAGELPPWHSCVTKADCASPSRSPLQSPGASERHLLETDTPTPLRSGRSAGVADSYLSFSPGSDASPGHGRFSTPLWSPLLDANAIGSGMPRLHRELKPSSLSTPAFLAAAAARRHLYTAATVDAEWPVLNWPYVSDAYMQSLAVLLPDTTSAAPGFHESPSAQMECVTSSSALVPPAYRRLPADTGFPPLASAIPRSKSSTSIGGASGGRPRAGSGSTVTSAASMAPDDAAMLFAPPVFAEGTAAASPSHRIMWFQAGLLTTIVYVRAEALVSPPSLESRARCDVSPLALQAVADTVRDVLGPTFASVEAALSGSLDASLQAAKRLGMESVRHVHLDTSQGLFRPSGFSTVSRQAGLGRDPASSTLISQSSPMPSAAVNAEIPRHLLTAMMVAEEACGARVPLLVEVPTVSLDATGIAPSHGPASTAAAVDPRRSSVVVASLPVSLIARQNSIAVQCALAASSEAATRVTQAKLVARNAEIHGESHARPGAGPVRGRADTTALPASPPGEQHMFATRYEGALGFARTGARETYVMFNARTVSDVGVAQTRLAELARINSSA